MARIILRPNHPLLAHELESFAAELEAQGHHVEIKRPTEARHKGTTLEELGLVIALLEFSGLGGWVRDQLYDWLHEGDRRKRIRRLEVTVLDQEGQEERFVLPD